MARIRRINGTQDMIKYLKEKLISTILIFFNRLKHFLKLMTHQARLYLFAALTLN